MNRYTNRQDYFVPAIADFMSLAAAPSFIIMALITGMPGGGPPDLLCSAAHGTSPLSGMVPMYLLMSAFHSMPWVKLITRRRSAAGLASWIGSHRSR